MPREHICFTVQDPKEQFPQDSKEQYPETQLPQYSTLPRSSIAKPNTARSSIAQTSRLSIAQTNTARSSIAQTSRLSIAQTNTARSSIAQTSRLSIAQPNTARSSITQTNIARSSIAQTNIARSSIAQTNTARSSIAASVYKSSRSVEYVRKKYGNPTPLGLSAFALSVMITSIYDASLFGIDRMDMIIGVALFTGGVVQFAAGLWEFKVGNTFGATGFAAFGGFWASYGVIYLKGFGIQAAYNNDVTSEEFNHALGIYYSAWAVFTNIFALACLRTNLPMLMAFVFLALDFGCLAISTIFMVPTYTHIAGYCGIICSCIVWYCFAAVLLTPDLSPISLPLYDLSPTSDTNATSTTNTAKPKRYKYAV